MLKSGSIRLDKPLDVTLKGYVDPYSFQVGVLKDGPHKLAGNKARSYAGLRVMNTLNRDGKNGQKPSTLNEVAHSARVRTGINFLVKPFKNKNDDAVKMMGAIVKLMFGDNKSAMIKRVENLVQAVVRNPILRADYGRNRFPRWNKELGGKRKPKLIATSQLFRAITAAVRINRKKP